LSLEVVSHVVFLQSETKGSKHMGMSPFDFLDHPKTTGPEKKIVLLSF